METRRNGRRIASSCALMQVPHRLVWPLPPLFVLQGEVKVGKTEGDMVCTVENKLLGICLIIETSGHTPNICNYEVCDQAHVAVFRRLWNELGLHLTERIRWL